MNWLNGTLDDVATYLAERAAASRMLGVAVKPGETPPWADELIKTADDNWYDAPLKYVQDTGTWLKNKATDLWQGTKDTTNKAIAGVQDAANKTSDTVNNDPFLSRALMGGVVGAGLGGLAGYTGNMLSSNKHKRPLANAGFGALLGGTTGALIGGGMHAIAASDRVSGPELTRQIHLNKVLEDIGKQKIQDGTSSWLDSMIGKGSEASPVTENAFNNPTAKGLLLGSLGGAVTLGVGRVGGNLGYRQLQYMIPALRNSTGTAIDETKNLVSKSPYLNAGTGGMSAASWGAGLGTLLGGGIGLYHHMGVHQTLEEAKAQAAVALQGIIRDPGTPDAVANQLGNYLNQMTGASNGTDFANIQKQVRDYQETVAQNILKHSK